MTQADDSLSTRLTCGVKGSYTTTREVEGEVWTAALPQWVNVYLVREDP
jgi:hypothetical protein